MALLQELREKRAKAIADARKICDKADAEKRQMNAEEQKSFDTLMDEGDQLKARIGRAERLETAETELESSRGRAGDRTLDDEDEARAEDGDQDEDEGETEPPRGRRREETPEPAPTRRGDNGRRLPASPRELRYKVRSGEERVYRFEGPRGSDEFRADYASWLATGHKSQRLSRTMGEIRSLSADAETEGGFLVAPMQMIGDLLKFVDDAVFVRQYATVIQMPKAQSLGIPTLDADPDDGDWTAELETGSDDTGMKFGKRELNPVPLAKRIKVSRKLLRMAMLNAEALVRARLGYKFAITEEKNFYTGDGAGKPLGLFVASSNGISTNRDVSTGNTNTAIGADGLIEAKFNLKPQYWGKARWLFHRLAVKQIRQLKDSYGQYLWMPGLTAGEPDRILDIPYEMSEYVPNTFTTGKYVGLLGDLSFYWIAEALSLEIQRLDELFALTNQVGFIGRMELDGMPVLEEAFIRVKLT